MKSRRLCAAAGSIAAIPVLLIADVGTAHAYPAPTAEGGRGRVQVTAIPSSDLMHCYAQVDNVGAFSPLFGGAGQPTSTLFQDVPIGPHVISTWCRDTAFVWQGPYVQPVDVTAPNPVLDTVDNTLAGIGSSTMTTDPTLR